MRNRFSLPLLLLLATPLFGFGQQEQNATLESLLATAQQAQAGSDYKAAADAYKQAVKIRPDVPEMWANLGLMEHETADYTGAIETFQRAYKLKPSLYVPNLFLGIDLTHAGKAKEAIPYLLTAEKINNTDSQPHLALGRAYFSLQEYSLAAHEFANVTHLDPKQSTAWFSLGIAYLDQVEADARIMSEKDQDSPYAKALFAESLANQSRYLEAVDLYKNVIASNSQPPCMHTQLGLVYAKQHDDVDAAKEFEAEDQKAFPCALAASGKPAESPEAEYTSARSKSCGNQSASNFKTKDETKLQLLAACSFLAGNYELSSRAASTLPQSAEALYWSIQANENLAFQALEHYEELEPNSERSHLLLGDIYIQRERYDDAQAEYQKAIDLSPNDPGAVLGLGSAYFRNGNVSKTVETAQLALNQLPDDPEINLLMGEALMARHDFTNAEPFLKKALQAKPQMLPHVHALLGRAYAAEGRVPQAIDELRLGLASDEDGSVHYQLARLYRQTGDAKDAAAAMDQMKAIQQKRRENAVIAFKDSHPSTLDDEP
ncbi:tetratricopeptide repeat protein [Alloacidobacterium dinghuense]|uniref:Tetratricopeptide repeat protein n=1 Tax=Alloacidobacterium dinghuense TaxID=2763107 RepID=A0A7G8BLZ5_9BACT|nr:tetratricopeptide repeat protein [Alloacidobacterium dinghuense]QNI33565.1 tetratricopeptide repeat protein [Alloacidobacterium dinghuense]